MFVVAWVYFLALSSLWALASPIMSAPDEPAHAVKAAAVVRGQWLGQSSGVQGEWLKVEVPEYIAGLHAVPTCYAHKPDQSAGCAPSIRNLGTSPTESSTSAGNYNPLYYSVVGVSTLITSGQKAIYGMRLITALWCSLFFALALAFAHMLWPRRLPLIVMGAGVTPMCLFLAGSINPNPVEIATTLCAFVCAYAMLECGFAHARLASLVFGVSAFILANLRGLSVAWLAVVLVGAVMLQWRPDLLAKAPRTVWIGLTLAAIGVGLGVAWQFVSNSFESLGGSAVKDTPAQVVSVMLERSFDYAKEYVGVMGWLDTALPNVTYAVWDGAAAVLLVGCVAIWRGRRRLAVLLLMAVILVLPAVVQVPAAPQVGYIWQGRYILPLVVVLFAAGGIALEAVDVRHGVGRNVLKLALGSLVVANAYGFLWVLRRYVTGLRPDLFWENLFASPLWQPPGGWPIIAGLYALVTLAAALVSIKYVSSSTEGRKPGRAIEPVLDGAARPVVHADAGETR